MVMKHIVAPSRKKHLVAEYLEKHEIYKVVKINIMGGTIVFENTYMFIPQNDFESKIICDQSNLSVPYKRVK